MMAQSFGLSTRSIHAGEAPDPSTGAHGVPIYQNATFAFRSAAGVRAWREGAPHFVYARDGNPTVRCLELKLADLEGTEDAVATGTGMAAISATLLHLLGNGGHLVASADVYGVTKELLRQDLPAFGATVSLVDFNDLAAVEAAITPQTRALFCEPFSNPMLKVADLPALGRLAAARDIALVVDNTFLSPALLRPVEHGATVVIHSATKYLSGHGNALGGIICGPRPAIASLRGLLSRLGGTMGAFPAWVFLTGVKTLPLRVREHSANAAALAGLLADHPAVAAVYYPGLPTHPRHEIARRLVGDRCGGMLAFALAGGEAAVGRFLDALTIPTIAVSLGDCATLIWPLAGTNVLRLSVGLEDLVDLESDFAHALAQVGSDRRLPPRSPTRA
ncbi:MAG: trans-sulfuration enzyme family protein [Thermomicrobiales bacterium]